MGELLGNVAIVALVVVGLALVFYLAWVAATSKTFVAVSGTLLMASLIAVVFIAAIVGIARLIPWWAAVALAMFGSAACFLAIVPTVRFGLSRVERQLRAEYPEHWQEGESSAKSEVGRLAQLPESTKEADRLREQLHPVAAEKHFQRESHRESHFDSETQCLAFDMAFTQAYWSSLNAAGFVPKRSRRDQPAEATDEPPGSITFTAEHPHH